MTAEVDTAPTFSVRTVAALIAVGVVAFCGFLVLSAYAPDLRTGEGDPGAHALSRSAVGFAGLERLLRADGVSTVIGRSDQGPANGLWVVTPRRGDDLQELVDRRRGPVLVVLPKWRAAPHPSRPGWVTTAGPIPPEQGLHDLLMSVLVEPGAVSISQDGSTGELPDGSSIAVEPKVQSARWVSRTAGEGSVRLVGTGALFSPDSVIGYSRVDRLQTLNAPVVRPVLVSGAGPVIVQLPPPRQNVYVLSDPDLLNNQGLRSLEDARSAVLLIRSLSAGQGVTFDVTLHGYERGRTLLRTAFEPPFLAATLCFVAAALLMGAHAAVRFGPAARPGRVFALGKTALADNAAGLIALAGREARFLPAYASDARTAVARAVGAPRDLGSDQLDAFLDRIGATLKVAERWTTLNAAAHAAHGTAEVADVARRLHRWRLEMTVGRS